MKRLSPILVLSLIFSLLATSAKAINLNLVNIDMASPESRRAEQLYGNAYGYPPEQVAPAMLGPAEEVPAIMQIAQSAGTLPFSVWMMRRMGMSYSRILQNFAVAPLVSMGQPITDPYYVETSRVHFLRDMLQVSPLLIPRIPIRGLEFTQFIINPIHPQFGYWMPPGIAKKYGMWMPPGQAKKMGWGEEPWGHNEWKEKHGEGDHDEGHGHGHWKHEGWEHDNGKHEAKHGKWDRDDDWKGVGGGHDNGHGHGHGK